jgi:FAD dependent oxidoreductase TIGR03364
MNNKKHFDLIVVGSGALGTFHAYHALKANLAVLLIERDSKPVHATVRNFGQVVPSGMSSEWFTYGIRSTEIYSEIQQVTDISVRRNGSVYIASESEEVNLLHELKARMDARSYSQQLLSRDQCLQKWPSLNESYCKEALFFPQEISVEPDQMIHRVLAYMCDTFSSLTYKPSTTVVECTPTANGAQVVTNLGELFTADHIVVCSGSEFSILFPEVFRNSGVVVSKLQMIRTVPLPNVALPGNILTGLTIRRYESFAECPSFPLLQTPAHLQELKQFGIHILFKQALDGSIIIGDSHEYAPVSQVDHLGFSLNHHINTIMLAEAQRVVKFNVNAISSQWAGYYAQHPEKDILEITIGNTIHVRTAIGGKGMTSGAGYAEESIRKLFDLD